MLLMRQVTSDYRSSEALFTFVAAILGAFFNGILLWDARNNGTFTYDLAISFTALDAALIAAGPSCKLYLSESYLIKTEIASGTYSPLAIFLVKSTAVFYNALWATVVVVSFGYYAASLEGDGWLLGFWTFWIGYTLAQTIAFFAIVSGTLESFIELYNAVLVPTFIIALVTLPDFLEWTEYLTNMKFGLFLCYFTEVNDITLLFWGLEADRTERSKYIWVTMIHAVLWTVATYVAIYWKSTIKLK